MTQHTNRQLNISSTDDELANAKTMPIEFLGAVAGHLFFFFTPIVVISTVIALITGWQYAWYPLLLVVGFIGLVIAFLILPFVIAALLRMVSLIFRGLFALGRLALRSFDRAEVTEMPNGLTRKVDRKGRISWTNADGKLHREDGPAAEDAEGKFWYRNGQYHREDGPAIEFANGSEEWYVHGHVHREDGPAIVVAEGITRELSDRHLPGPARIWIQDNFPHREDGPAIERADGGKEWALEGVLLTEEEWRAAVAKQ